MLHLIDCDSEVSVDSIPPEDTFRQRHFTQWVLHENVGYCSSLSHWTFFGFVVVGEKVLCIGLSRSHDLVYSKVSQRHLHTALRYRLQKSSVESPLATLLDLSASDPDFFFTLTHAPIPPYLCLFDDDPEEGILLPWLVAQLARPFRSDDVPNLLELNTSLFAAMDWRSLRLLAKRPDSRLHDYQALQNAGKSHRRGVLAQHKRFYYQPLHVEF